MPLSEHEQKVLDEMERHLSTDDPRLANTLTQKGRRPVTRYLVAVVGSLAGIALLVLGAHLSLAWVGAVGFVLMFGAVAFAFGSSRRRVAAVPTPAAAPKARRGMMSRLEERWARRRDQQG